MNKLTDTKFLFDSIIPLGMTFGCAAGVIFGIFLNPSFLVFTICLGTVIGYLLGLLLMELIVKKENHK